MNAVLGMQNEATEQVHGMAARYVDGRKNRNNDNVALAAAGTLYIILAGCR